MSSNRSPNLSTSVVSIGMSCTGYFFRIFNTNNLWIRLDALDRVVKTKSLDMEVIVNRKVKLYKLLE